MRFPLLASCLLVAASLCAKNTVTEVAQVTGSVQLTTDVDYTITGETPFTTMGSVDIVSTEHAALVLQKVKPSKVIASYMTNILINGEPAVNGTNCQVKMYGTGAIVLPYGKDFRPLTCFTEEGFAGNSCNNYATGHTGGYMNTLTAAKLNNNIRSFKLKRGYMVTFAIGTSGWGYSRCFVADEEDLELSTLPKVLSGKISSFRLFQWYDAQKKGLASDGRREANDKLNTSWCYDWGQGNESLLPDVEWVPNHIYEDWPSSSTCGSVSGSCNMKTNNEPGNAADDHPQTVEQILDNWQNLMRTGMRLCSPSSHDGSLNHLRDFMNEIDKRGWRCDMLDMHCYWPEGSFYNYLESFYNSYKRPIWISEWVWGASWNKNGIFATDGTGSTANQQLNYDHVKPILDHLNETGWVERYAYWNSEADCSKIYFNDGTLSILGKYYASMSTPIGYNKRYEYVPNVVVQEVGELLGTFEKNKRQMTLEWEDPNGDMMSQIKVQMKTPGSTVWEDVTEITPQDQNGKGGVSYSYTVGNLTDPGIYFFRVVTTDCNNLKHFSNDVSCTISAAYSVGSLLYGQLKIANTESVTTEFDEQEAAPYVVMGMVSNKNSANGITNQVQSLSVRSFRFRLHPWTLETPVEISSAETIDYLLLPPDTVFHFDNGMMLISQKIGNIKGDEVKVVFPEPFPEGVTPVVMAQQNTAVASYDPVVTRVYDITRAGFSVKLERQAGVTGTFNAQNVNYFACSPGQLLIGDGKMLTVGSNSESLVGGTSRRTVNYVDADGQQLSFRNPTIIAGAQTNNYPATNVLRQHSTSADDNGEIYCGSYRRQVDGTATNTPTNSASANGDKVGWFIISDAPADAPSVDPVIVPTAITTVKAQGFSVNVHEGAIFADAPVRVFNTAGVQVPLGQRVPAGIYVVTNGQKATKIAVR
ncbi:MAG: hypothetical protein HUK02_03540 [Bacteroidaceae bacterium]|nr:hypothetical protein [Bacteroidaceae bacterium]